MMSSKRAAGKAFSELLEIIGQHGEKIIFKSYAQMGWISVPRWSYHRKLARFEQHGLIKRRSTAQGHVFIISKKVKELRRKAVLKVNRTDGNSTLIIFDIPEEKRNARDTLRRYLIRSGYTQIRESCFLSPFQIASDLKDLIAELKLAENVSFFSAKTLYVF